MIRKIVGTLVKLPFSLNIKTIDSSGKEIYLFYTQGSEDNA